MGRNFAAVVFSLGCLQASSALALGLGELQLDSYLNEPLKASVNLLNADGMHQDEIRVRLGTREDFKRLGLERSFFLTSIQFDIVVDEEGRGRILMSTDDPVLEPYLDFIIEARWPSGRLLREYTVLIDPPAFSEAAPVVSASQRVEEEEGIPAPGKKKVTEGADTGTRVDVRESDLGPGEMPQRDFNAAAGDAPMPGGRYMIARDDTLWGIASKARPDGASVHQTMLDIQRLNPDAFINNNINRVKAGYIIYLPGAADISSSDLDAALAEVREQNAAWREGRDAELAAQAGPSLRISADPVDEPAPESDIEVHQAGGMTDDSVATDMADADSDARLASLSQQVETLQRIVNLKDEQIAALQDALRESDSPVAAEALAGIPPAVDAPASEEESVDDMAGEAVDAVTEEAADVAAVEAPADDMAEAEPAAEEPAPAVAPAVPKPIRVEPAASGGIMDYLWYIVGGIVVLLAGLFAWRRRSGDEPDEDSAEDVFSEVELSDAPIAVEEEAAAEAPVEEEVVAAPERDNRGYGERKHDAYASDLEAADALAEADIYIAYGRHQQAIDLLGNALANEPDNPHYRLKLLEIHTELANRPAAAVEMEKIRASGNAEVIAEGEALLAGLDEAEAAPEPAPAPEPERQQPAGDEPGLAPNPLAMMDDDGEELQADFAGLEIEEGAQTGSAEEEDLDLSKDFEGDMAEEDEELVIAADANGLSTKLDLARAYLDMGDDDGARQILDEIIAEGSDELKAEAQGLLDRIG